MTAVGIVFLVIAAVLAIYLAYKETT